MTWSLTSLEDLKENVSIEGMSEPSVSVKIHTSLYLDHKGDIWRNRLQKRKHIDELSSDMEVTVEPTSPNIKMTVESKETDTKMSEEHDKVETFGEIDHANVEIDRKF